MSAGALNGSKTPLVEQMAAAASSLKSQAGELVHTVAVFKLQA